MSCQAFSFVSVRWLWHLTHGDAPTNEAIAAAAEHTGQWLTGLLKQGRAPTKAADHRAVAAFFGVSRDWLFEDVGEAPMPDLWPVWLEARGEVVRAKHVDLAKVRPAKSSRNAKQAGAR